MKHIKSFSNFLFEGYMSELDIIRKESKTWEEFADKAKKEFPQIAKMKEADIFLHDLWKMSEIMKESVNEGKEYFFVTDGKGKYLTRKTLSSDYSFTDNYNFAYTYDDAQKAGDVISVLKTWPAYKNLDLQVIGSSEIKK